MINDKQAARLASHWQQAGPAMAEFVQNGSISRATLSEVDDCSIYSQEMFAAEQISHANYNLRTLELSNLRKYLSDKGRRGPQREWE